MKILSLSCFIMYALIGQVRAQQSSTDQLGLSDCVNTYDVAKASPTKVGHQFWFVNKDFLDGRTLKLSAVGPGLVTHPPHQHVEDEFFFVLEGTAEFHLDGKTKTVEPYTTLYCPSQSMHGIRNTGKDTLKYLVIKKYH